MNCYDCDKEYECNMSLNAMADSGAEGEAQYQEEREKALKEIQRLIEIFKFTAKEIFWTEELK